MNTSYDAEPMRPLSVYIGRWQPGPHKAHAKLFEHAAKTSERVLILIGSAFERRSEKNPWTYSERHAAIRAFLANNREMRQYPSDKFVILPLQNMTTDEEWYELVCGIVNGVYLTCPRPAFQLAKRPVSLIATEKDEDSYWVKGLVEFSKSTTDGFCFEVSSPTLPKNFADMSSTQIRKLMAEGQYEKAALLLAPGATVHSSAGLRHLVKETQYLIDYRKKYGTNQLHTADAFLIANDKDKNRCLLLIKRAKKDYCGDCLAMVGGFIDEGETPQQAILREISEEVGLSLRLKGGDIKTVQATATSRGVPRLTVVHILHAEESVEVLTQQLKVDPAEVQEAFFVPFHFLRKTEFIDDHWDLICKITSDIFPFLGLSPNVTLETSTNDLVIS